MGETDPTLDYFTTTRVVNPRWGLRIVAGFAGALLLVPTLLMLIFSMTAMLIGVVTLVDPVGTVRSAAEAGLTFLLLGGSGLLVGWISVRLLDFAQRNTFRVP